MSKFILLAEGICTGVDDDVFEEVSRYHWRLDDEGYVVRDGEGPNEPEIKLHRVVAGTPKGMHTHHVNSDRLDNRRESLRVMSASEHFSLHARQRMEKLLAGAVQPAKRSRLSPPPRPIAHDDSGNSLITITEAGRLLGIGRPTAKWLVENGTLKAFTMPGGKKRFVSRADVERLADGSWRRYKPRGS